MYFLEMYPPRPPCTPGRGFMTEKSERKSKKSKQGDDDEAINLRVSTSMSFVFEKMSLV